MNYTILQLDNDVFLEAKNRMRLDNDVNYAQTHNA